MVSIAYGAALGFVVGGFVWAYVVLRGITATPLILHFNDTDGITSVGGMGTLAFMGVFGVVMVLMNGALALALDARDRFFGKFLAAMSLVFGVLLFAAFAAIINANV